MFGNRRNPVTAGRGNQQVKPNQTGAQKQSGQVPIPEKSVGQPTAAWKLKEKDIREQISHLSKIIGVKCAQKEDIVSSLNEIAKEIQSLISELIDADDPQTEEKGKSKIQRNRPGIDKSTLTTAVRKLHEDYRGLNGKLLENKRKKEDLLDEAIAVGKELGIQMDQTEQKSLIAKKTLETILKEVSALKDELHKLNQEIFKDGRLGKDITPGIDKSQTPVKKAKGKLSKDKTTQEDLSGDTAICVFRDFSKNIPVLTKAISNSNKMEQCESDYEAIKYRFGQFLYFTRNMKSQPTLNSNSEIHESTDVSEKKKQKDKTVKHSQDKSIPEQSTERFEDSLKEFDSNFKWLEEEINRSVIENSNLKVSLNHVLTTTSETVTFAKNAMENKEGMSVKFTASNDVKEATALKFNKDIEYVIEEIQSLKTSNRKYIEKLEKATREKDEMKKENDALQLRLSKMAGSRLTEGNPNITNLGDPNRPMKIGEAYSELYDNEWTDAIDLCAKESGKKFDEDNVIKNLFQIIMCCYKLCSIKATESEESAKKHLKSATKELMIEKNESEIIKQVMDIRKLSADIMAENILKDICTNSKENGKKYFKSVNPTMLPTLMKTTFFSKSLKLCWKMIIQDPPLILDEGAEKGHPYDKNVFREYTSSGSKVVFTVWPALYLHRNGALLVKGVVKVK